MIILVHINDVKKNRRRFKAPIWKYENNKKVLFEEDEGFSILYVIPPNS